MNKPEEILERLTEQMQNIIKETQEGIKKRKMFTTPPKRSVVAVTFVKNEG